MSSLDLLMLLMLLLPPPSMPLEADSPCNVTALPARAVCSPNATLIGLSGMGLTGHLNLTFDLGHPRPGQLRVNLLDLSGNPGLTGVTIGGAFQAVQIGRLDISGTAMAPVPGRLLSVTAGLLSVHTLKANGTVYAEPLDLGSAADLMYRMRVQAFALIGWPLANGLPANLTSQDNSCASKRFHSIAVSRSRFLRSLNGGGASPLPVLAVSDSIDLSANGLRTVSNVAFSAGLVDLSDNQLTGLPGVSFRPGSVCRSPVTGWPTLLLRRNRLAYAAIDSLAASVTPAYGGFAGLDLSWNDRLLDDAPTSPCRRRGDSADKLTEEPATAEPPPQATSTAAARVAVSDYLDLSGVAAGGAAGGHLGGLAALLARFRPATAGEGRRRGGPAGTAFRLSLADNGITDLASAAALVTAFVGVSNDTVAIELDLSGNPLVHLNLSDMPPHLLSALTALRLPRLRSASVRVLDGPGAGVLERLRRRGGRPDGALLASLWSQRVPLRVGPQQVAAEDGCCLTAHGSELVCTYRPPGELGPNSGSPYAVGGGGIFCHDGGFSGGPAAPAPTPPELPFLFTCIVLGCALLLGLATGIAVYYARHSRGRYAVYSIYAVYSKDQRHQQHQMQLQQQNHCTAGRVQLKAVNAIVQADKAATPL